jgi:hypothetical protein
MYTRKLQSKVHGTAYNVEAPFNRFISHSGYRSGFESDTKEKYIVAWNNLHVQAPFYRFIFFGSSFRIRFESGFESKVHGKTYTCRLLFTDFFGSGFGSGLESKVHGTMSSGPVHACKWQKNTKRNKVNYEVLTRNSCENSIKQTSNNYDN